MQTQTVRHAWFSLTAANTVGTVTFRGIDGNEVIATAITNTKDKGNLQYPDLVYKGQVTEHIRGALHNPLNYPWGDFEK